MQRLHARVSGKVQGVGFREYVRQEAITRGLTGYVRNDDADLHAVEIVAEGDNAQIESLLAALHSGPRFSRIEKVESAISEASHGFGRFSVEH